jgi:hypothetical protein
LTNLCVPRGSRADCLVRRVLNLPLCIPDGRPDDARHALVQQLDAPEASPCKCGDFVAVLRDALHLASLAVLDGLVGPGSCLHVRVVPRASHHSHCVAKAPNFRMHGSVRYWCCGPSAKKGVTQNGRRAASRSSLPHIAVACSKCGGLEPGGASTGRSFEEGFDKLRLLSSSSSSSRAQRGMYTGSRTHRGNLQQQAMRIAGSHTQFVQDSHADAQVDCH